MITSSLVIGVVTTVVSALARMMMAKMDGKQKLRELEIQALSNKAAINKDVREYENKGFQYTRRFIAITTTICVMALPFLVMVAHQFMYPAGTVAAELGPTVVFGYEAIDKGFWPFTSDATVTKWEEFRGIVITPWHTEMFAWIMGMYFGTRLGETSRR